MPKAGRFGICGCFIGSAIGAFLMRGAGCTWNDFTDRNFDSQVARTRSRPIPSGQVTPRGAFFWGIAQALMASVILFTFNWAAIALGVASLALVADLSVRQALHLVAAGLSGSGLQLGRAVALGRQDRRALSLAPIALYLAGIAWTLHYDTIYAHQDREDDALIGVRSTARLFGDATPRLLWMFTALAGALAVVAVLAAGGGVLSLARGRSFRHPSSLADPGAGHRRSLKDASSSSAPTIRPACCF